MRLDASMRPLHNAWKSRVSSLVLSLSLALALSRSRSLSLSLSLSLFLFLSLALFLSPSLSLSLCFSLPFPLPLPLYLCVDSAYFGSGASYRLQSTCFCTNTNTQDRRHAYVHTYIHTAPPICLSLLRCLGPNILSLRRIMMIVRLAKHTSTRSHACPVPTKPDPLDF